MNKRILVRPWPGKASLPVYDIFFATVGFEQRARYIAETLPIDARKYVACAFADRKEYDYYKNMSWFQGKGYEIAEIEDSEFLAWFATTVNAAREVDAEAYRFAVDISSSSRLRLAAMVEALRALGEAVPICVDFLYSLAQFSPPLQSEAPNVYVGPV